MNGTKRPALDRWEHLKEHRPTRHAVADMFCSPAGLGVVCGATSGNLEMLEFEGRAVVGGQWERWIDSVHASSHAATVDRLLEGYCEMSPTGGIHLLYRVDNGPVPGNTKLARYVDPDDGRVKVLAETRGQGGYVVVAPTNGKAHPTGRPWQLLDGSFATIPTLSGDERRLLLQFATFLDELPPEDERPPAAPRREPAPGEVPPGEDFNLRADWMRDVLGPQGWQIDHVRGDVAYLVKPGSNARDGHHATLNYGGSDLLYNFSTAAWPLEAEESYSKFGAYCVLEHGGDFKTAARELARRGYGTPRASRSHWRIGKQ